jgi:hypothetical protein
MSLETRIKDMYGFGVGISTVFEISGHFLFKGDRTTPYGLHHQMLFYKRNKHIHVYSLGVGMLIVFEKFSNFLFCGVWVWGWGLGVRLTPGTIYNDCIYCL